MARHWYNRYEERKRESLAGSTPVEPTGGRRVDGSPKVGPGQAYVITGTVYHPVWCKAVADTWDQHEKRVKVVELGDVGGRRECQTCVNDGPLTD